MQQFVALCKCSLIYKNIYILVCFSSCILVPETCSPMFRKTVESLFITHAETKLNTKGNIVLSENQYGDYYPVENPWLNRGDEWCQGLVRRPKPKPKPS